MSRISVVIRYVSYVGIVAHVGFIGLFLWLGLPAMAAFNVGSVATWVAARAVNARGRVRLATALLVAEVLIHAALATWFVGWRSGYHYYVIPLIPFVLFNDQLRVRTVAVSCVALVAFYWAMRVLMPEAPSVPAPPLLMRVIEGTNVVVPFTALALITAYFRAASLQVEQRMEALAMTDALTALPNRRQMRELLERARAEHERGGRGCGLVLGDVDGFKRINDTCGHDCGDHVLREIGKILRAKLRGQDVAARWGGEEFIFLLPETDLRGAAAVAENLREAVARAELSFGGRPLRITMTFGVSAFAPGRTIDECVRLADAALYAGKGEGKNRVVLEAAA